MTVFVGFIPQRLNSIIVLSSGDLGERTVMYQAEGMTQRRQSGITLVVVLVILLALTFLGLGAMSDSNLQLAMVRNAQLQNMAHSGALTEINAQIDVVNMNEEDELDAIVVAAVATPAAVDLTGDLLLPGILGATVANSLDQQLTVTEVNGGAPPPVEGTSLDPNAPVKWLAFELDSAVGIQNTASNSNQIQGFRYLSAN